MGHTQNECGPLCVNGAWRTERDRGPTVQSLPQLVFGPGHLGHEQAEVVHGVLVRLLSPEVVQGPHVLGGRGHADVKFRDNTAKSSHFRMTLGVKWPVVDSTQ